MLVKCRWHLLILDEEIDRSHILCASDHFAFHLSPVDIVINGFVNFATYHHIIASDQVQAMLDLGARFGVIRSSNYAFNCIGEDEIR